ncbi:MAG TPA: class I SAM-dependent methyltransferase [Pedobacter sp.]|jgi:cyclopropane fatty-acyl-phospholipid synthase-like methyltransferase
MSACTICKSDTLKYYRTIRNELKIYECLTCLNAITLPPPNDIAYEEDDFHGQFNFNSLDELPRQWKKALVKQINLIKRRVKPGANILEIGCGQGLLLQELKTIGYNTFGVEPSKTAYQIAEKKGLAILNGYFPETNFNQQEFDLIIMSQVLEHIENPLDFLSILGKMYPGKYLMLIQSNYKGIVPQKNQEKWYAWLPEQHYSHFTAKGLQQICKMLGFTYTDFEYSTLEHNDYWLSRISEFIPCTADQLHCLIKL